MFDNGFGRDSVSPDILVPSQVTAGIFKENPSMQRLAKNLVLCMPSTSLYPNNEAGFVNILPHEIRHETTEAEPSAKHDGQLFDESLT
ncbi:hypothetical protein BV25DRAFT_1833076 [Artomyces pyxidatus]|uniref:Uncharacterized protein n=1 Tax=Artomyces pyxidatus TaxID=48021 RepID=A0ACB8SGI8_9AGAM|nr:hypothetical protein BV25DRAFT_1833076 [Artomyces pyxidatus]